MVIVYEGKGNNRRMVSGHGSKYAIMRIFLCVFLRPKRTNDKGEGEGEKEGKEGKKRRKKNDKG